MSGELEHLEALADELRRCVKCGFCASFCPVYRIDRVESRLPRGKVRITLLAVKAGRLSDESHRLLDACVRCGACSRRCPSQVGVDRIAPLSRAAAGEPAMTGLPETSALMPLEKAGTVSTFLDHHRVRAAFTGKRVTWHRPCRLVSAPLSPAPQDVLSRASGLTFAPMAGADECCGLGGEFARRHAQISSAMTTAKLDAITEVRADIVVTACHQCAQWLTENLSRTGNPASVILFDDLFEPVRP